MMHSEEKQFMPEKYTTTELGIILSEMKEHLSEIKAQVTLTNGKVKQLQLWRSFLIGAWAVLSIVTPLVWYVISQSLDSFKQNVSVQINQAIQDNNSRYFEVTPINNPSTKTKH